MNKVKNWLKAEFITGHTIFDWSFLALGLVLQVVAIIYGYMTGTPDNALSIISAITGIISVVLCAQGKISFYFFGYIQLFTYFFGVAIPNHLYGEIWENVFYLVTMIYGTYIWAKHYKSCANGEVKLNMKRLDRHGMTLMCVCMAIGTGILTIILHNTNDPVPFFDAITTVPAFIAQIYCMLGYRDQWIGWAIEDISSVIMFMILGNWVMVAQYIFWTANTIYGWVKWSENKE